VSRKCGSRDNDAQRLERIAESRRHGPRFTVRRSGLSSAPKAFMTKLFAPMIATQVPKQTVTAMESSRALLAQQP
jgi:hypothetical protein